MNNWKQSFGVWRNIEGLDCARIGISDNCIGDNKGITNQKNEE